jgi:hypothetical protein
MYLFSTSCYNNDLQSMKWLYEHSSYIKQSCTQNCLYDACENGYMDIVTWLCDTYLYTDVTSYNGGFTASCTLGHYKICKWLVDNGLTFNVVNDDNFRLAVISGNLKLCKWLTGLNEELSVDIVIEDINNYDKKLISWLSEICPTIEKID